MYCQWSDSIAEGKGLLLPKFTTPPKGLHDHRLAYFPFIMLVKINLIYLPTMYVYCLIKKKIPLYFFPLIVYCRKNLGDLVYLYGTVVLTIIQIPLEMFMLLLYIFIFRENAKYNQDRIWRPFGGVVSWNGPMDLKLCIFVPGVPLASKI
jgi:hypothetical protein